IHCDARLAIVKDIGVRQGGVGVVHDNVDDKAPRERESCPEAARGRSLGNCRPSIGCGVRRPASSRLEAGAESWRKHTEEQHNNKAQGIASHLLFQSFKSLTKVVHAIHVRILRWLGRWEPPRSGLPGSPCPTIL